MSSSGPVFTAEERENFKNAFDAFDDNRDDLIHADVLGKLLRAVGFNPLPEEVEDMIKDVGTATIDFNSFLYLLARHARCVDPEAELVDAFKLFDKQGTGKLKAEEIKKILQNLKQPFTEDQINMLFSQTEIDEKGLVKYEDFVKVMLEF
jgi:calmodulin